MTEALDRYLKQCDEDYERQGDEENWSLQEEGYYECSCAFCFCANLIEGGGVCNDCLGGAHQG